MVRRWTNGAALDKVNWLFLIPGMDHCGIRPEPGITSAVFDPLTGLETWLEIGDAPDSLMTTRRDAEGNVDSERPVCAWPARAVHDGSDDWRSADSLACAN